MASSPLRFDGKVVLVTGAGNGLGKAYALDFGARGASVVVNDLGGSKSGTGSGSKAADKVVEEIRAKGGIAVANYDSVEFGEKVVQTALDNFGKIDVVVNNAGILRDKSFARIRDEDWDIIHNVHLRGSFLITRAAWPHMRKQGYGRIIMVTSAAGIYGNFGQGNYSAAKLGAVGLSNTLAIEGRKYNIQCNAVAPFAGSRLTASIIEKDLLELLKPEYVSPLVVYLCHDSCPETGSLFEVGGGYFGKLRWQRTEGIILREENNKALEAENVRDNWDRIADFNKATFPKSTQDSLELMIKIQKDMAEQMKQDKKAAESNDPAEVAKSYKVPPMEYSYTEKDSILYALGVGTSTTQPDYLKFLFELADDFSILPSFGVIPAFICFDANYQKVPGFKINKPKLLHGEQYMELFKPLPRAGKLISTFRVVDALDKGSGLNMIYNIETFNEKGEKVVFNQFSIFIVGSGNFGGKKTSSEIMPVASPPTRAPDARMEEKTSVDQAALYRLNGDSNELHIDPAFAAKGGLKSPILHGLCSMGYATRHVMATFAGNDVTRFKALKVRFTKPVYPGQTLRTEMWKEGNRIFFKTLVVETGGDVITGAYVDLHPTSQTNNSKSKEGLRSNAVFNQLSDKVKAIEPLTEGKAVYQWNITHDGVVAASWTMDLAANDIYPGQPRAGPADCTLTLPDQVFVDLISGKTDAQRALLNGSLDVTGNITMAQKLGQLFPGAKI